MGPLAFLVVALWAAGLVLAALTDLGRFVIPNRLNLFLALVALAGLALAVLSGRYEPLALPLHVAVAAGVLAFGIILYMRGYIGGGDAKLLAVLGLWCGPADFATTLLVSVLLGGVFSLVILAFRALPLPDRLTANAAIARLHLKGGPVPYGVPIALGALLGLPTSELAAALFHLAA